MGDMLSAPDRQLLLFEEQHPAHTATKQERARVQLGYGPTRYYQRLYAVVDDPEAEREFPMLVHRVRRVRDLTAQRRASRSFVA